MVEHGGVRLPSRHMSGRPPSLQCLWHCKDVGTCSCVPRGILLHGAFIPAVFRYCRGTGQASRVNPLAPARGGRVRACMLLCCPGSGFPCHSFCRLLVAVSGCASPRPPCRNECFARLRGGNEWFGLAGCGGGWPSVFVAWFPGAWGSLALLVLLANGQSS